jgi:hypothetical protein
MSSATPTVQNVIDGLYVAIYNKAADSAGYNYWLSTLPAGTKLGTPVTSIASPLLTSLTAGFLNAQGTVLTYFNNTYPPTMTNTQFVQTLYQNLGGAGSVGDAAGVLAWTTLLNSGASRTTMISQFIYDYMTFNANSPAAAGLTPAQLAAQLGFTQTFLNKISVSAAYAQASSSTAGAFLNAQAAGASDAGFVAGQAAIQSVTSASDSVAAAITAINSAVTAGNTTPIISLPSAANTFTLTTDIQALHTDVAGAIFNATPSFNQFLGKQIDTLQANDSNISSKGDATLNFINGGGVVNNVTLSGIKTANITQQSAAPAGGGFYGAITGLTDVTIMGGASSKTTLGFAGLGLNTALANVNLKASQDFIAIIAPTALAGAADAVTVNITGAFGTKVAPGQVAFNADDGSSNVYETETINATAATFAQLSDGTATNLSTTAIKIGGAGAVQLTAFAGTDFSNVTSIDASANTGGVNITGASYAGAGAGLLTNNTVLTSFTGGAGNDTIDLSNMTLAQLQAVTTLDGKAGVNTLKVDGAILNTTTALTDANFQTIDAVLGGVGGAIDVSKLGAAVNTVKLDVNATAATTFNNVTDKFNVAMNGHGNAFNFTFNGPSGTSDTLNITDIGGATQIANLKTTAFENVNFTVTGTGNDGLASIASTPTAGGVVKFDLVNNQTGGGTFTVAGASDVGAAGTLKIDGTSTGSVTLTGDVTAAVLDASGATGIAVGSVGLVMGGKATSLIQITGTGGQDTLVGSGVGADSINGGAGNDAISNELGTVGFTTSGAVITTGAGSDTVALNGAVANGAVPAVYSTAAKIADFTVSSSTTTTDHLQLYAGVNHYQATALWATGAAVTGGDVGSVLSNVTGGSVAGAAGNNIFKLVTPTAAGADVQATFDAAMGAGKFTGLTASKDYAVTIYDSTNNVVDILSVNSNNGTNTAIEAGDTVRLIGTISMSAADYASFGNTQVSAFHA